MAADSREIFASRFRAVAAIKVHRRIERVETHQVTKKDMKSASGKAFKQGWQDLSSSPR